VFKYLLISLLPLADVPQGAMILIDPEIFNSRVECEQRLTTPEKIAELTLEAAKKGSAYSLIEYCAGMPPDALRMMAGSLQSDGYLPFDHSK